MRYDQRPQPGVEVYLAPRTRLASRACHEHATVTVVGYDWPMVEVELPNGDQVRVDSANVLLHPPKSAATGDQAQHEERRIPKPMGGKSIECVIPEGEEQGSLW